MQLTRESLIQSDFYPQCAVNLSSDHQNKRNNLHRILPLRRARLVCGCSMCARRVLRALWARYCLLNLALPEPSIDTFTSTARVPTPWRAYRRHRLHIPHPLLPRLLPLQRDTQSRNGERVYTHGSINVHTYRHDILKRPQAVSIHMPLYTCMHVVDADNAYCLCTKFPLIINTLGWRTCLLFQAFVCRVLIDLVVLVIGLRVGHHRWLSLHAYAQIELIPRINCFGLEGVTDTEQPDSCALHNIFSDYGNNITTHPSTKPTSPSAKLVSPSLLSSDAAFARSKSTRIFSSRCTHHVWTVRLGLDWPLVQNMSKAPSHMAHAMDSDLRACVRAKEWTGILVRA